MYSRHHAAGFVPVTRSYSCKLFKYCCLWSRTDVISEDVCLKLSSILLLTSVSREWSIWNNMNQCAFSGNLKSNVDFHCRRSSEGNHVQSVLLKEVVIEPNVRLECVPKFYYLGDTLGAGGVEEAARARVRCAWAKFKKLSPIPTAQGHHTA